MQRVCEEEEKDELTQAAEFLLLVETNCIDPPRYTFCAKPQELGLKRMALKSTALAALNRGFVHNYCTG